MHWDAGGERVNMVFLYMHACEREGIDYLQEDLEWISALQMI